jgi:adenylosuccinate synthase
MSVTVILGEQRGDEGKGRFVDMLAEGHEIVARFNGGNNAGHTVVLPDARVLKLHSIPSGIAHNHTVNIIGNGTLVNPVKLVEEIEKVKSAGVKVSPDNLLLSSASHLILPQHISADEIREAGKGGQGSTKSGIAQVAADKYMRVGMRCEALAGNYDKLKENIVNNLISQRTARTELGLTELDEHGLADKYVNAAKKLRNYVCDTVYYLNNRIKISPDIKVLAEGAQAFLLDIDHGMYPYTTSSNTTSGGVVTGLGIPPQHIKNVIGVIKAVQSHVGGGNFVTEIDDKSLLEQLHGDTKTVDAEFGTTTGRIRRLGHLDLPGIRRSQMINGTTEIALTKLDWVPRYGDKVAICIGYRVGDKTLDVAPDTLGLDESVEPIYEYLPTWTEDISGMRKFSDLPKNAQNYIKFIEEELGTKIKYIGVGPARDQVIVKS